MQAKKLAEKVFAAAYPDCADWFDICWNAVSDVSEIKKVSSAPEVAQALGISSQEISTLALEMYKVTLVEKLVFEKYYSLVETNKEEFLNKFEEVGKQVSVPGKTRASLIEVIRGLGDDLLVSRETTANLGVAEGEAYGQNLKKYSGKKLRAGINYKEGKLHITIKELKFDYRVPQRYVPLFTHMLSKNFVSWPDALIVFPQWAEGVKKPLNELLTNNIHKINNPIEKRTGRKLLIKVTKKDYKACYTLNKEAFEIEGSFIEDWENANNILASARDAYNQEKYDDAKSELKKVLSLAPYYLEAHYLLIKAYSLSDELPSKAELENIAKYLPKYRGNLKKALDCLQENFQKNWDTEKASIWNSQQAADALVEFQLVLEEIDSTMELFNMLWKHKNPELSEKQKWERKVWKHIERSREFFKREDIELNERNKIIEEFIDVAKPLLEEISGRLFQVSEKDYSQKQKDENFQQVQNDLYVHFEDFWEEYEPKYDFSPATQARIISDFKLKIMHYIRRHNPDLFKDFKEASGVSNEDAQEMQEKTK